VRPPAGASARSIGHRARGGRPTSVGPPSPGHDHGPS
jgi:hypothetical protein